MRQSVREVLGSILIPAMIGLLTVAMSAVQLSIASYQREQEKKIAEENQLKDIIIAQQTREQELLIVNRIRWDSIFSNYIHQVSEILRHERSMSTVDREVILKIISAKTLATCRQLDRDAKNRVIQFLYDLQLIRVNQNPIDLRGLELNEIMLNASVKSSMIIRNLMNISLVGVFLTNASFVGRNLFGSDFSFSDLQHADFYFTSLENVSFHGSNLSSVNFSMTRINNADLSGSDLRYTNINDEQLHKAYSIFDAYLPNNTFGRSQNFLENGDAEIFGSCSKSQIEPFKSNEWRSYPNGSIGLLKMESSLVEKFLPPWMKVVESALSSKDLLPMKNLIWETGKCSFAIDHVEHENLLIQDFIVFNKYSFDDLKYLTWVLNVFCIDMQDQLIIDTTLTEFNEQRQIVGSHIHEIDIGRSFRSVTIPLNHTTHHGEFKISFRKRKNNTEIHRSLPLIALCDNIHLSLEKTAALRSVQLI